MFFFFFFWGKIPLPAESCCPRGSLWTHITQTRGGLPQLHCQTLTGSHFICCDWAEALWSCFLGACLCVSLLYGALTKSCVVNPQSTQRRPNHMTFYLTDRLAHFQLLWTRSSAAALMYAFILSGRVLAALAALIYVGWGTHSLSCCGYALKIRVLGLHSIWVVLPMYVTVFVCFLFCVLSVHLWAESCRELWGRHVVGSALKGGWRLW